MIPYYADESVTLHHGDCLTVTEWLTADVLVTGECGVTTSRSGATLAGSSRSQSRRALPRVPVQRATPRHRDYPHPVTPHRPAPDRAHPRSVRAVQRLHRRLRGDQGEAWGARAGARIQRRLTRGLLRGGQGRRTPDRPAAYVLPSPALLGSGRGCVMTCLRYPATDPYYPGHVIHLRGDEDPHEFVRAMPRAVEFIECDCRAAQRDSRVSEGAETGRSEYNGDEHETGPTWTLATSKPGPDRDSTPTSGRGNRG